MKILLQTTVRLTTAAALAFSSVSPAAVRAQAATPNLSATQTAQLIDDVDHDGLVDPGDTLRYTVVVSNTGSGSAEGVSFVEPLDANTTPTGFLEATPLAHADVYTATNAADLVVTSGGLLSNDFGLPSLAATPRTLAATAEGGAVTIDAAGTFTYTAAGGFTGTDAFTYTVSSAAGSDSGLATVNVFALPVALDEGYTALLDTPLTVAASSGVLANDTLAAGAIAAFAAISAEGGSVSLNGDGSFVYTPPTGFISPPVDTFTYTLENPVGSSTATVSITVDVPGPPVAASDSYTTTANAPLTVPAAGVFANDTRNGAVIDAFAAVTAQGAGVALAADGGFVYTPTVDFVSPPTDTFTYTLRNSLGASTATVSVTVLPVGAPVAVADAFTTTANLTLTVTAGGGLFANDTLHLADLADFAATTARGGSVSVDADGGFTYVPPVDTISPPTDSFTYTLANLLGASTAAVTLTINPPAEPATTDDAYTATADTDRVVSAGTGVLANDTLHFGAILDFSAATTRGGSVLLAPNGAFTYTPPAGVVSPPFDTFTYTVGNALGQDTATVRITINPPGTPLTVGDSYTTTVNTDLVVPAGSGVLANDTLRFGTLSAYAASTARGGSVVLAASGAFTYTPPADTVSLPADSFTYTVSNTLGDSTATVTLTLAPPGAPTATADAYTATANTQLIVNAAAGLFDNDTVHYATLSDYAAVTSRGGSVLVTPTGAFTYTPPADTISPPTDSFTYTLDNLLGTSTATVTLTIDPPAPPTAVGESYTATVNVPLLIAAPGVLANDALHFGAITAHDSTTTQGGTLILAANGAFTYTSAFNTLGVDTATYTLGNALGTSTATLTVTVLPPPPVAVDDTYTTTGNVDLSVAADNGVLDNDTLNWGALSGSATTSAQGGVVAVNANGSFTYNPPTGFTGTDTFTYTVSNALTSDTATVSITVSERVWFVDNTAAAGGTGRHSAPFDTLAEAEAASSANDYIYVYYGDGTSTGQNAGITLKAGQRLLGQADALTVNDTMIEPGMPGNRPLIVAGSGNAVTAPTATGVEVRGLRLTSGPSGDALGLTTSGSANAGLTLSNIVFSAPSNSGVDIVHNGSGTLTLSLGNNSFTGGAPALRITRNSGTVYITDFSNMVVGSTATEGIQLSNVIFDATPGGSYAVVSGGTTALGASGNPVNGPGLTLTNVSGDVAFTDLDIYAGGAALSGSGSGSFATTSGFRLTTGAGVSTLSASGGPAVALSAATLDLQLSTLTSTGSSTTGVALTNIDGTFTAGAGSTITGAAATDFFVDGGSGTVTYNGTITNTAGRSVVVSNRTGGTHAFTGAISDTGTGVQLTNNTGATINFSGGLTLNTGVNGAFSATGGGTVTVTGATNTIVTTTGTGLTVANTAIGAGGLTFRSVSSNGAASGIVLNTTGASGGLTVSGTGSAGSGGTIQNSTGAGIALTNVTDVSLAHLNITTGGDDGIYGSGVTNFTLTQSTLTNNGNSVTDEGLELDNVAGTLTLNTVVITGSAHNNVWVDNASGTLSTFAVTNGSYQNTSSIMGAHGILLTARGTASIGSVAITGAAFTSNFSSGVFVDVSDSAQITDALVQGATFTSNANALTFSQSGSASQNFRALSNTLTGAHSHAINVFSSGTATGGSLNGRIVGNTIGAAGVTNSGSATGDGIRARIQGQTNGVLLIDTNVIRQTPNGRGIEVVGGSDSLDVTITNNDVNPQAALGASLAAILVNAGNPTGGQFGFVRSDVRTNTVPSQTDSLDALNGEYLVLDEDSSTTLQLVNTSGAANASTQLDNTNTGSAAAYSSGTVDLIAGPIGLPPLQAADGQGPGADATPTEPFEALLAQAIHLWSANSRDVSGLAGTRLAVTDLPDGQLAEADAGTHLITLDTDAAGWGWSLTATPTPGRIDALTVIAHEVGHLLGFAHADNGVMAEALARGKRILPTAGLEGSTGGSLTIPIGTLPAGRAVTLTFDAVVSNPVAGGAYVVSNQGTLTGANITAIVTDDPTTPAPNDATVTALDVVRALFLPALLRGYMALADLTVSVSLSPNTSSFASEEPVLITVVVTNIGNAPADDFWVDAYLNPSAPPTVGNQVWNERCGLQPCFGLAWYVTEPLLPGASVTLTSGPGGPYADNTIWPGYFAPGTTDLYIYADSYSDDGGPGALIREHYETNNRAELHGLVVAGITAQDDLTLPAEALPAR